MTTGTSSQSKKRKRKRKKKGDSAPKDAQGATSEKKEPPKKELPKKDAPAKDAPKKVSVQQKSTHPSGVSRSQRRKEQGAVRSRNRPEFLQKKNLRPIPGNFSSLKWIR